SESLPTYEVSPILPREIPGLELSMLALSDETSDSAVVLCRRLADSYGEGIEKQERAIDASMPERLKATATRHVRRCRDCLERIEDGIELVASEPVVRTAFSLMNRAMLMQQVHYGLSSQHVREWRLEGRSPVPESPYEAPSHQDPSRKW